MNPTHRLVLVGHFSNTVKVEHPIPHHLMHEAMQAALVPSTDPQAHERYPISHAASLTLCRALGLEADFLHTDFYLEPIGRVS